MQELTDRVLLAERQEVAESVDVGAPGLALFHFEGQASRTVQNLLTVLLYPEPIFRGQGRGLAC